LSKRTEPGSALRVLIVDDEPGIRGMCREFLEGLGCQVHDAASTKAGREALSTNVFDLAIFDVRLPDGSGLDLFRGTHESRPDLPIAIITGHASVEDAVDAVKSGSVDYITKPFDVNRLKEIVELVKGRMPAAETTRTGVFDFHGIIGISRAMRSVCELIKRAAQTPSTVLIQGESGTGKELAARAVHEAGPNANEPFVPIDCGSIPAALLESELFGHTKGSFTGAHADSPGLFRSAGKGTVFLDEIGELPHALQAKLLRALQEHEVRAVGATRPQPFKARVIVATNRDLQSAMADGEFRRDLFYRLHVVPISMPPLRTRPEDIVPLARHFLRQLNAASDRTVQFSKRALTLLAENDWPGNVRELQNRIESAFTLTPGDMINEDAFGTTHIEPRPRRDGDRAEDYEKQAIQAALLKTDGNRARAAKILGIGVATLFRKLKKYDLK